MLGEDEKLIYCPFGDFQAIDVVSTAATSFRLRRRLIRVVAAPRNDGCWVWSGVLEVENRGSWPLTIAIVKPEFDNEEWRRTELGFEPSQCLRVVGGERSKNLASHYLVRLFSGLPNEAHMRDFGRYPFKDFGLHITNRLVDAFIIGDIFRRRRNRDRPRLTHRASNCYALQPPYADRLVLVEGSYGA